MTEFSNQNDNDRIFEARPHFEQGVLILDDKPRFLSSLQRRLSKAGFRNVLLAIDTRTALSLIDNSQPEVCLIDIHLEEEMMDGLEFIEQILRAGYDGIPVVLSGDRSTEQFFRAARAGARDFLIKGPHVDISQELIRLLHGRRGVVGERKLGVTVTELGYLRSFGMTAREISLLSEYAEGFPRLGELADRVEQAPVQLRKIFSRIYRKLGVSNLGQLAHILTVCAMFERDN